MLGDVLLIEDKHRKAARQIMGYLESLAAEKTILSMSGGSGSGKSEIAHLVAQELKDLHTPAKVLHMDNYYRVPPQQRKSWRLEHGLERIGPDEYDWELINRHMADFRGDAAHVTLPCIDLLTDQVDELTTSFEGLKYMVLEGLFAIKAQADLRILIDLTHHETKSAQHKRGKEKVNGYRWQVLEREHQEVQALRPLTDLLVTRDFNVKEIQ